MKRWIMTLAASATVSGGCAPLVLEPIEDTGYIAIAMRAGDIAPGVSLWLPDDDGNAPDPDSLVLLFSSDLQQCSSNPVLPMQCDATPFWQSAYLIPPELNHVGPIDLLNRRTLVFQQGMFPSGNNNYPCDFGTMTWRGFGDTLEIISSGPSSLVVNLSEGTHAMPNIPIDGDYLVHRCGPPPPEAPPEPALAIYGADLPPPPVLPVDASSSGNVNAGADALHIFLGSAAHTCEDPWAPIACTETQRVTFSLPPELQQPGVIELSDPAISASYGYSWGSQECIDSGGGFEEGTIEILSIDEGGLVFKVYGSGVFIGSVGFVTVDGLYAASICPSS